MITYHHWSLSVWSFSHDNDDVHDDVDGYDGVNDDINDDIDIDDDVHDNIVLDDNDNVGNITPTTSMYEVVTLWKI